jgi:hypothetical protein
MKTKTEKLLKAMNVLAWIAFIGLMVQAGGILVSYYVSIGNAEAAKNLYNSIDLYAYRTASMWQYSFVVAYKAILFSMQAYIAYLMTSLLSKLNISMPFKAEVVKLMHKISYLILYMWIVAMVNNLYLAVLEKIYGIIPAYIPGEFILLAAVVYVFAQMFKRGVEIQSENELTI